MTWGCKNSELTRLEEVGSLKKMEERMGEGQTGRKMKREKQRRQQK